MPSKRVSRRCRRYRGTMVMHQDVKQEAPRVFTDGERLKKRKRSRAPKKRLSSPTGKRYRISKEQAAPTVYSTLVKMLFVLMHIRPGPSDDAFNVVASWTQDGMVLSEADIIALEDRFHAMDRRLDHLFNPWVRELRIYDTAYDYMDIPFLVDVITHISHDHVMRIADDRPERESITHALALLHSHLLMPPPSRRLTI